MEFEELKSIIENRADELGKEISLFKDKMLANLEVVKNNEILEAINRVNKAVGDLNLRITALEARIPDPEEE